MDSCWSPTDSIFALYVPEWRKSTCKSKEELKQKNLFSVSDCKMYWQSNGEYLAVKVDRYTKTKKSTYNGFELFRIKERDIPIEVFELDNKNDKVIAFSWEPKGVDNPWPDVNLQTKDDLLDNRFSVATKTVTGVTLSSTATNRKGVSTADVGALYKSKSTSIGVKIDTHSNITMILALKKIVPSANITASFKLHDLESSKIATTLTLTKIIPSTKVIASFQLPDFRTGKLVVEYLHHHATLASTIALNQAPTIDVSATIGTSTFAMGALAAYETSSSKFTNFIVGINVRVPNATASMILGDKGDMIRGTYMHHFDVSKRTAAAFEITRRLSTNKTSFLIGGSYVFDGQTVMKGKLNSWGKLGVVLQHEIIPKSRLKSLVMRLVFIGTTEGETQLIIFAKLARPVPDTYPGEADMSKDMSGPESLLGYEEAPPEEPS
ncbi:mitochondrial outer membrane protein porin 2-like protein [Tanacetum coccineum]